MDAAANGRPPPRSAGAQTSHRVPQTWPPDRDFRILSIDGGGIRGIFPAAVLAELERRFLGGAAVTGYFDLIAGTSTGGILALGLAAGYSAAELRDLYVERGSEIFPPYGSGIIGHLRRRLRAAGRLMRYSYNRAGLERLLVDKFGTRKFGSARVRLCIPAFEGEYGEVHIFKTPHHEDFKKDLHEPMVKVALATAAAPTYYRPLEDGGYTFVDGGVWANNPVMIALVEALTSFDLSRDRVRILSIGCGEDPYRVAGSKIASGGRWHWRDIMFAAMRLQSLNALGQAGLLIGPERLYRLDVPKRHPRIELDDWKEAVRLLPAAAAETLAAKAGIIAKDFLSSPASVYVPHSRV